MARKLKTMDGNTATAWVSYAFTEVASIYPITPSSPMADETDKMSANGVKNIFGQPVRVIELQSEGGASGAMHGSLQGGALTTTYTASQGLLLMIPNMYKMAGELLPGVIHVSARSIAASALCIFGDHSDINACRQTGFAMLCSNSVQECMDLGAVAHLSAIKGRLPFVHFFDGFRTSHEIQKIEIWDYDTLAGMVDYNAVKAFRDNALNPEHPVLRGTAQNSDTYFQSREACNPFYDDIVGITEDYMNKVNAEIGTDYGLFNYHGAKDAEKVIVAMGSVCDTIEETIDYLNSTGEKLGLVKVHLYHPFSVKHFLSVLPKSCKYISVLDRTKEPGSLGEPLYLDILAAINDSDFAGVKVSGGRYGLGSKDTTPAQIKAVYDNMVGGKKHYTVGIEDDVTNTSLTVGDIADTTPEGTTACKFWGLGADGTVGANKNSIKIIGDHTDMYAQAYFAYDSKKSGGVTVSHLRFGHKKIKGTYLINKAAFVACHNPSYVGKYDMVQDVKPGGTFLLNCGWNTEELSKHLPGDMKAYIAKNNINFYTIDGIKIGREIGLGGRINTILQAAFFKLANIIPVDDAVKYMKEAVVKSYSKKGEAVVNMNFAAIDRGITDAVKVDVPADWADCSGKFPAPVITGSNEKLVKWVKEFQIPVNNQAGDKIPVSAFKGLEDGTFPQGSAAYEKRCIAVDVPDWTSENCIQCGFCALVCPHAVIRPFALTADEAAAAPAGTKTVDMVGMPGYKFNITASVSDCTGCGACVQVCPGKKGEKALAMKPLESKMDEQKVYDYMVELPEKAEVTAKFKPEAGVKGSQLKQPLLEFSGACAGCGETPYAKLATQLYGDQMYIANATGCSMIWASSSPSTPYTVNKAGHGPAWGNSLFEDNAEYGYGIYLAAKARRDALTDDVKALVAIDYCDEDIAAAGKQWLEVKDDREASKDAGAKLLAACKAIVDLRGNCDCEACKLARKVIDNSDMLAKKSVWILGGDGWAYDIGFGGLDHVLASGEDVNVLVFDTEVYSNTGGQASKASQIGQVAQFAAAGKAIKKKDLAGIAMSYGYVYTAQVAMGANYAQCLKAFVEAENYKGPSIIIAYAPCINHGIKGGMTNAQAEEKRAVESGYWHLFRFNPALESGKFTVDSKEPTGDLKEFLLSEVRYSSLTRAFPERAEMLFDRAVAGAKDRYEYLTRLQALYGEK